MARAASGLSVDQIQQVARKVLGLETQGIRYKDLVSRIQVENPKTNPNTIQGALFELSKAGDVLRPSRGHWILAKFANEDLKVTPPEKEPEPPKFDEQAYYDPFAKWLRAHPGSLDS
jgi:hypothetical protein